MPPPPIDGDAALLLGAGASLGMIVSAALLTRACAQRALDPRWFGVILPLVALGVAVGCGCRVLTAAVHGANIGAGMVVFGLPPLATVAVALSVWQWRELRRDRR